MKTAFALTMAMALALITPSWAQRGGDKERSDKERPNEQRNEPRANRGRIPTPPVRRAPKAKPEAERREGGRMNSMPHVSNDHWYGHDKPNDRRYHMDRPFSHGRFEHIGVSYRYHIVRLDPGLRRFWLPGGYFFEVALWDWPLCEDWCWECAGEDFVVYDDLDHPGWYLLYNIHTGGYVHVQYMGM
jgi:hypothetical protein